jgi:hypothetical protein
MPVPGVLSRRTTLSPGGSCQPGMASGRVFLQSGPKASRVMISPSACLTALWASWIVVWLLAARVTTGTVGQRSATSRLVYSGLMLGSALLLILQPRRIGLLLSRPVVPGSRSMAWGGVFLVAAGLALCDLGARRARSVLDQCSIHQGGARSRSHRTLCVDSTSDLYGSSVGSRRDDPVARSDRCAGRACAVRRCTDAEDPRGRATFRQALRRGLS